MSSVPRERGCLSPYATSYYITDTGGHHLTSAESTYRTSPLKLAVATLENEITRASDIDTLTTAEIQDIVKTLAFFLAETARFYEIEIISNFLIGGDCSAEWLD